MKKENFIVFSKNRKNYKVRGYKDLRCDSFFQEYNKEDNKNLQWWEKEEPKDIPIFFPFVDELREKIFYRTTNHIKNTILGELFPCEQLNNIVESDIIIKVLEHKVNKHNIDTALLEISPAPNSFIDFIPVCIIIYKIKTKYVNSWRSKEYTPGDNLGIMIPYKFNTVTNNKHGIIKDNIVDTLIDIIETLYPGIYKKLKEYLPEEDDDDEFNKFAIETAFELLTGNTIPEIKYDLDGLIATMDLIQL